VEEGAGEADLLLAAGDHVCNVLPVEALRSRYALLDRTRVPRCRNDIETGVNDE
jgi:hypothetical protein